MAIIDLVPTVIITPQAFKTAPGDLIDATFLPNGLLWFTSSQAIAAKIATNETHITCTLNFPRQYTYILKNLLIAIRITEGTTNNFSQFGIIDVIRGYFVQLATGPVEQFLGLQNQGLAFDYAGADVANPMRIYDLTQPFKQLIQPPGIGIASFAIKIADEDAGATNAGTFIMSACFYRYNVEQALASSLNTAQPVMTF